MSIEATISGLLLAHVAELELSPPLAVAYPDRPFTPPDDEGWLRVTLLPAATIELGPGYAASDKHQGLLQIDVFYPRGGGEPRIARTADLVIAHFLRGTKLTDHDSGLIVELTKPASRTDIRRDDPWAFIPVRIPWLCLSTPA